MDEEVMGVFVTPGLLVNRFSWSFVAMGHGGGAVIHFVNGEAWEVKDKSLLEIADLLEGRGKAEPDEGPPIPMKQRR